MPFELPSADEVRTLILASLSGYLSEAALVPKKSWYKLVSAFGLGATDVHEHARQVGIDLNPLDANGVELARWAQIFGLAKKGASGAAGVASYRVFGEVGETVPSDEPLTHLPSGLAFETRSSGVIGALGFLDVDIAAIDGGEQTNLEASTSNPAELSFDATPTGLETVGRIVLTLTGGQDAELDDALRARLLDVIALGKAGGRRADYRQFVLAAAVYVDSAYVLPNRNGLGTVDLVALRAGSGAARLLDAGERDEVSDYVDVLRPVSATTRVLEVVLEETDVEALVLPESDPQFGFDWSDQTPPEVSAYDDGTRLLTFAADRPIDMKAGDRVALDSDDSDGREHVIESLSSTNAVVLTESLGFAPAGGDLIYSGGPLVAPARAAIQALANAIGPANPGGIYGPWDGSLRVATMFEAVQTTDGVLDSDIVTPAATVDATDYAYPDNNQIGLVALGQILVRRWWQ